MSDGFKFSPLHLHCAPYQNVCACIAIGQGIGLIIQQFVPLILPYLFPDASRATNLHLPYCKLIVLLGNLLCTFILHFRYKQCKS